MARAGMMMTEGVAIAEWSSGTQSFRSAPQL